MDADREGMIAMLIVFGVVLLFFGIWATIETIKFNQEIDKICEGAGYNERTDTKGVSYNNSRQYIRVECDGVILNGLAFREEKKECISFDKWADCTKYKAVKYYGFEFANSMVGEEK